MSEQHLNEPAVSSSPDFQTRGYEDMELSTQILIREALRRKVAVQVLDRQANFIRLMKGGRVEYVKQATRTSRDSYISALIMENKQVTKTVLSQAGIAVPPGYHLFSLREFETVLDDILANEWVVKPNTTNFGKGITILDQRASTPDYLHAVQHALEYDDSFIVERFIPGPEYRFLVIGRRVLGVLNREAANVIGDGTKTIRDLIHLKNENPYRGSGYTRPLEKIKTGTAETQYLLSQGLTMDSVPLAGEKVFLRKNSNISTGGDSIDTTEFMEDSYKQFAVKAAETVGSQICGVDMIISDPASVASRDNYAVIELNFNPALHIHNFPHQGKNRRVEKAILDLLGFTDSAETERIHSELQAVFHIDNPI